METKFKVGDRVKVINVDYCGGVNKSSIGGEGEVTEITNDGEDDFIPIKVNLGSVGYWFSDSNIELLDSGRELVR